MRTMEGNEPLPFDWSVLVPPVVHPMRVTIVEALRWIRQPLSAIELKRVFDGEGFSTSYVSYHLAVLAEAGIVEKAGERQAGGVTKRSYFFPSPK